MKDLTEDFGEHYVIHEPQEARWEGFPALRAQIFDLSDGVVSERKPSIFRDESWTRIIVQGSVLFSDASHESREEAEELDALEFYDPRDQLQLLFDVLIEDGIDEIIHMRPYGEDREQDAVITRPTRNVLDILEREAFAMFDLDRLLFDRTGKWGFYGGVEMFGLLGGEPGLMERYIDRAGGMEHIRKMADTYWQDEVDTDGWEANLVPNYYRLAGWDNPPQKRSAGSPDAP
jgi:hypothetical protein